jgi:hypothetical protein
MKLTFASTAGFSTGELAKLDQALARANEVVAAAAFKSLVLAYQKDDGTPGFEATTDTAQQVFDKLTAADAAIVIAIRSYSWIELGKRREVAHEDSSGGVVLNRRFFTTENLDDLVDTIIHEFCHVRGYHHRSAHDYRSVPYGVGQLAGQVSEQLGAPAANAAAASG